MLVLRAVGTAHAINATDGEEHQRWLLSVNARHPSSMLTAPSSAGAKAQRLRDGPLLRARAASLVAASKMKRQRGAAI